VEKTASNEANKQTVSFRYTMSHYATLMYYFLFIMNLCLCGLTKRREESINSIVSLPPPGRERTNYTTCLVYAVEHIN